MRSRGFELRPQTRGTTLDEQHRISLVPDISIFDGERQVVVADAKYKALTNKAFPNADAYQMLAYCTALSLDRGTLIYARDDHETDRDHDVVGGAGIRIQVRTLDVTQAPAKLLAQVEELAGELVGEGLRDAAPVTTTASTNRTSRPGRS